MQDIKSYVRETRKQEIERSIQNLLDNLKEEGLLVEFGEIGLRTTYARIHDETDSIEIVGYTYLKDLKYKNENLGKLKALQQAIARRELDNRS